MIIDRVVYKDVTVLDLLAAVIVLVIAVVLARLVSMYLRRALREKIRRGHLETLIKVVYYAIIIIGVLAVLPGLGIEPSGLLVAGGVVGLAVGFASQTVVSNLLSGLLLMIERPLAIGSPVDIEGTSGFVEDIRIISTTIRTWDGLSVRVPNGKVFTSTITNFSAYAARRFEYVIGVRYSDDAEKALQIINRLVDEHPFALKNPAPQVFVDNLGDSSVNIIARIWGPMSDWFTVKADLLWKIKKALEEEGIEIPFPQRVVWLAGESAGQPTDAIPPAGGHGRSSGGV